MQGTIVERNGKLYVCKIDSAWSIPERITMYWPVAESSGNPYNGNRPGPGDIATYQRSCWTTTAPAGFPSTGSVRCVGNGNTPAEIVEKSPILAPKVRKGIETRYHEGRWQKLLKSGWVNA